mmetsp:Transcript_16978/g.35976  ORF Transcript_16978/g.35976 Transcript_16978/m.35976 type:complete len:182 (-) Transcript_16978:56-601(-)
MAAASTALATRDSPMYASKRFAVNLDRTIPAGGADEHFAKYFAEVTLDVVEEQHFKKRQSEEVGPRHVHLRLNAIGQVAFPPHIEENRNGEIGCQLWTGHAKVDRTMFIMDRRTEGTNRTRGDLGTQRHVPALRGSCERKNFGKKPGPMPFSDSFRATVLNKSKKLPYSTAPQSHMDIVPM